LDRSASVIVLPAASTSRPSLVFIGPVNGLSLPAAISPSAFFTIATTSGGTILLKGASLIMPSLMPPHTLSCCHLPSAADCATRV